MARRAVRPQHTPRRATVTPLTRGASRPDFPFAIPPPRPSSNMLAEEANLYSQPQAVPTPSGGAKPQFQGSPAAASARMRGRAAFDAPDDAEVDALGEAEILEPPDTPDADVDNVANANADVDAYIEAEVQRRIQARIDSVRARSVPQATPVPRPQSTLAARPLVIEDTDRLWDWIRADAQTGLRFFGARMANSMALHHTMEALLRAESHGVGMIRSIYYEQQGAVGAHLGFVMLAPILSAEQIAIAHIYLRPDLRGRLGEFLPSLLQLAAADMPGFKIAVLPADATQSRLYRGLLVPLGFVENVVFVR